MNTLTPKSRVKVNLTWPELAIAYEVSKHRRIISMKNNLMPRYGASATEGVEETEIFSCRGELAVAKCLNLYWSGSAGDISVADVGWSVEVRTVNKKGRRLIIHPSDRDWSPFVLVDASEERSLDLVGWMLGGDGKQDKYWADPTGTGRHAYFIDTKDLRPISELELMCKNGAFKAP